MDERRKMEEEKKLHKQMQADKKKNEIEFNIRMRKENRQRSVQEMIERTRMITAGILRPQVSNSIGELETLPSLANKVPVSKSMESNNEELRRNSQKYEDLLKK